MADNSRFFRQQVAPLLDQPRGERRAAIAARGVLEQDEADEPCALVPLIRAS
jgi:hypothetical protein